MYLEWVACAYCWILSLIMCFYLYQFWKRRNKAIFRKRYFSFVMAINLCSIFFNGYLAPMWILMYMTKSIQFIDQHNNIINTKLFILFDLTLGYPYIICQHLFTFLIFCRFWLLHFEIKWRFHSKQLDILTRINGKAKEMSWYLRNKNTWGSSKFCFRIMLILCLFVITASSFVYWSYFHDINYKYLWYLSDTILLILPIIGACIIWYNTPSFFDYFLIRKELSIIITFGIIGVIGYIITIISLIYTQLNQIILIIGIVFGSSIYSVIALISTFWILQYSGNPCTEYLL